MDDNFQAGGQPNPEPVDSGQPAVAISQDSKNMGMLCHLLGLLTSFLGPLIIWIIKKDSDAFVDEQGKEALNFQITVLIAMIASGILVPVCGIGGLTALVVLIGNLVLSIMACVAASKGEHYRYPVCLRLVK